VDKAGFNHLRGGYGSVYGRGNSQISLFEAAINVLSVFNMSATMARQGGWVQLEQPDMCLASTMATMGKEILSHPTTQETKCLIVRPPAEVQEQKK
jgi:hypothetical protein